NAETDTTVGNCLRHDFFVGGGIAVYHIFTSLELVKPQSRPLRGEKRYERKSKRKGAPAARVDFNKPSLTREGFASMRSMLAGVAETGGICKCASVCRHSFSLLQWEKVAAAG
ncbi:MAG: hypothetical protein SPG74_00775, partial [Eubacteriales bacterium]|nr:hypothetical protein [Eubacteriales bacterium]